MHLLGDGHDTNLPRMNSEDPIREMTVAIIFGGAILYPYCMEAIHGSGYSEHANADNM